MKDAIEGIIVFLITIVIVGVALGLPVMLLWDYIMPKLFGLPEITFGQAICLNVLSSILFKFSSNKD